MHPPLKQYQHYQQPPQEQQQQQQQPQSPQPISQTFSVPDQRQELEPEQERIEVEIDNMTFKIFVRSVYLHAAIFILASSMTWLVVSWRKFELEEVVPVPAAWWFVAALVLRMTMSYVPEWRSISSINWVMTICILILSVLLGASFVHLFPVLLVLGSLLGSLAMVAILYAIGAQCPEKMLPGLISFTVISCICLVINIVLFILNYFVGSSKIGLLCGISILCWVVVSMPFDAQGIHGRLGTVILSDALHSALTIFIHFTLIPAAICLFYLYHKHQ